MFKMAGEKDRPNYKDSDDFEAKMIDQMTIIAIYRNVKSNFTTRTLHINFSFTDVQ